MQISREEERRILLKRVFPAEELLKIGRQIGDSYCSQFDERGYDKEYKRFSEEEVVNRLSKLLSDQQILEFARKHKDNLYDYSDFKGKYYTYNSKSRELKLQSSWPELEAEVKRLIQKHGENARAFLRACYFVCVEVGKRWKNYYHIQSKAREFGMKRGWMTMLVDFELASVIKRHRGDISIPEELIPFIRRFIEP